MATFTGQSTLAFDPTLKGSQRLMGRWTLAADGQVTATYKSIGALPAGALLNATSIRAHVDVAWNGTTPTFDVFLVPRSTGTVDGSAILPTSVITEGTTGIYYSTAALVKTAGRNARLAETCEVVVLGTFGAADNTTGDISFVIDYDHDLDMTSYTGN